MKLIQELIALGESQDDNKAAWYVVRLKDDAISAGPFDKKPGDSVLNQHEWYRSNRHDYDVVFGIVNDDDKFQEQSHGK